MYCKHCGAQLDQEAKFCENCGNEVKRTAPEPVAPAPKRDFYTILARSSSSKRRYEEWRQKVRKQLNTLELILSMPALIYVVISMLTYKNDHRRDLFNIPWWVALLYAAIVIFVLVRTSKDRLHIQKVYEKYSGYCDREELVVDTEKTYGSASTGKLELRFDQIRSASVSTETLQSSILGLQNSLYSYVNSKLEIIDIAGHRHLFYSFENSRELCAMIEQQIRKGSVEKK